MLDYTIITATRDRAPTLARSLALTRQAVGDKVPLVVFDDASEDGAAMRAVVERFSNALLIRSEERVGPGEGRNRCMMAAETRFCLSLDDDCYLASQPQLGRWLEDRPGDRDVAVVSFPYFNTQEGALAPERKEEGGAVGFHGGASLMRRAEVLRAGGYLDWLVFAGEDTELAGRLIRLGYRVWFDPSVVVQHDHVPFARDERWESFHYVRNTLLVNVLQKGVMLGVPLGLVRALRRGLTAVSMPWETPRALMAGLGLVPKCVRERRRLYAPENGFIPEWKQPA
jgi:GT2 family glycosyltransferase